MHMPTPAEHLSTPLNPKEERYRAGRRVTIVGAVVNLLLSGAKVAAGLMGHSAAMVADGIHSLSDLISDGIVLLGTRIASQEADESHPYGHGKFEALATLGLALILLVVAVGIVIDGVGRLKEPDLTAPAAIALWAAAASIISKEVLFWYTYRVGVRYNAKAIIANAWHHRSDAISSIAALAGIGAAMLGWPMFDPVAAIGVAFIVGKVGVELFNDALKELTDSPDAVDRALQEQISKLVHTVPEVRDAHFLTPRRMGPDILVDVHVEVDPFLSVSEGHQVAEKVRQRLFQEVPEVTEVLVHVDTVDDAGGPSVPIYDHRDTLRQRLEEVLPQHPAIRRAHAVMPHYTRRGIILDLVLEPAPGMDLTTLQEAAGALSRQLLEREGQCREVRCNLQLMELTREGA